MLDNLKNFKITRYVEKPFSKLSLEFVEEFSNSLRKVKNVNQYPELIYLILWCAKGRLSKQSNYFKNKDIRIGRGIVFHVCASNVPTNFIYSFLFGLLSGNSNIIKIPSKFTQEKKIIMKVINHIFKKSKYRKLKSSNLFIEYNNDMKITERISAMSDARVLWGSDNTINNLRKIKIQERCVDITFPDRYSICAINIDKISKLSKREIKIIAKKFYYDGYTMNQAACNSPHHIFWVGNKNKNIQNFFWSELGKIVDNKFLFDNKHISDKYLNLIENIVMEKKVKKIKFIKNKLYVLNSESYNNNIENIRGKNGTFFEKNISDIKKLKNFITKKCQTLSYYGFTKGELERFLLNNNLQGIDRVVPIGNAIDIGLIWDGYDVVNTLSRVISIK